MPIVIGRAVHLHPVVTIFAVLVGLSTFGILGGLLAVPTAAAVNVALHEFYGDELGPPITGASRQHPYRVPPGEFYLLGDNRAISCDSRYWGPIQGSKIVGKVVLVWWANSHPVFRTF